MYRIEERTELASDIKLFKINAPLVAKKSRPGQFLVIRAHEKGERIPLTIVEKDGEKGIITIIFQEVGKTTKQLGKLQKGDFILDLVGPLGKPTEIANFGTVVIVGGGIGITEAYPETKALKEVGCKVISIIGARSKELLILEEEMASVSDEIYISTDDGSKGHHGFVTDLLKKLIDGIKIDLVFVVGPAIMMKKVTEITRPYGIKTLVSLNSIMVDATGMCGTCRVLVGGKTKFACVDGPTFDGHLVDFDLLIKRLNIYLDKEEHSCKLYEQLNN
ncbi:MAG: sulfide/dihydroorotate dehydrogenase-like FAD/NAD-binding protein [Candidatus Bathyarchaeota archaeon]|nr:sulfide/dihydroorotate dehydrogenase-like FAD/NAD-binding protein [Candidatus Bathyarchaeota archaeon]